MGTIQSDSKNKKELPLLTTCFIGHVDSGKSTTVGHFAYQMSTLAERDYKKICDEAKSNSKESFSFAYWTDTTKAERERGITIETSTRQIKTDKFLLNVSDCPGHHDFIKNMISGTNCADVGVIIIPAAHSEFENAISKGTLRDHVTIANMLGVKKGIVCLNKFDMIPEAEQLSRYNNCVSEAKLLLKKFFSDKDPIILPISGFKGYNLTENGEKFSWFKGWKPATAKDDADFVPVTTLEGAFNYQDVPRRPIDKPLRSTLGSSYNVTGVGTIISGKCIQGVLTPGMQFSVEPTQTSGEIKTLQIERTPVDQIKPCDSFGAAVKIQTGDLKTIKAGFVLGPAGKDRVQIYPAAKVKITVLDHPTGFKKGYTPVLTVANANVPCKIHAILSKKMKGGKIEIENPESVQSKEQCEAILIPQKDCVMESLDFCPELARFILRDNNKVVGVGTIEKLYTRDEAIKEKFIDGKLSTAAAKPGDKKIGAPAAKKGAAAAAKPASKKAK